MSHASQNRWIKIAESLAEIPFGPNNLAVCTVQNKPVTVFSKEGRLFACAYKCPHAGGILADGYVDELGNIVCPLHRYKFSLQSGRNTSGEGYFLKRFSIEEREDGVYINF